MLCKVKPNSCMQFVLRFILFNLKAGAKNKIEYKTEFFLPIR